MADWLTLDAKAATEVTFISKDIAAIAFVALLVVVLTATLS